MDAERHLYLLDGYNLLYRSFSSLPQAIVGPDGLPINALYGTLTFLLRLAREHDARVMLAAFDLPEVPTFRHQRYPGYQAQRGPLGDGQANEFIRQVGVARRLLPTLGVSTVAEPGYEADDVMGTLAMRAVDAGMRATVVSTDRDVLQLVRPGLRVLVPGPELRIFATREHVRTRIGVDPEGVTTFKALAGDASDNIPGVRGIGVKTAIELVDEYETLEGIYAHLDDLAPRRRTLLENGKSDAWLFRDIVTIVTDLPLDPGPNDAQPVTFSADSRVRAIIDDAWQATF